MAPLGPAPMLAARRLGLPIACRGRRLLSTKRPQTVHEYLGWKPETAAPDVTVNGYVRSVRAMKSEIFVNVGDGSTRQPLQAMVPRDMEGGSGLRVGAAVSLKGSWTPSNHPDQSHELKVDKVNVVGPSDASTYPIQKKYQTPEYLRTIPHLRSRIPLNAAVLRLRSDAIAALTQFFASRSFVQTHPPIITSSDCEGAGEVFTVSTGQPETSPAPAPQPSAGAAASTSSSAPAKPRDHFFRAPKYLTVSTQLHLEALAQSLGNVWTLSPTFRAERSDTSRHMSEFYMLEAEMPFVDDMEDVLSLVEDMLRHLTTTLYTATSATELRARRRPAASSPSSSSPSSPRTAEDDLAPADEVERRWAGMMQQPDVPWPRVTYADAIEILKADAHLFEHPPAYEDGLHSEHEKYLARKLGATGHDGVYRPVFVTHYPRDIKAFYMRPSALAPATDGSPQPRPTVDCFDLIVPDLCEIAGGSMREHRLEELLDTMQRRGMVAPPVPGQRKRAGANGGDPAGLDWYLDLRRWGSCPHGGFGLGFDRLLSYLAGVQNVRDVVAFPRWFGRCDA